MKTDRSLSLPFPVSSFPVPPPLPPSTLLCLLVFLLLLHRSSAGRLSSVVSEGQGPKDGASPSMVLTEDADLPMVSTSTEGQGQGTPHLDHHHGRDLVSEDGGDVSKKTTEDQVVVTVTLESSSPSKFQSMLRDLETFDLGYTKHETSDQMRHDLQKYDTDAFGIESRDLETVDFESDDLEKRDGLESNHLDLGIVSNETVTRADRHAYNRQFTAFERMPLPRTTHDVITRLRYNVTKYRFFRSFHDNRRDEEVKLPNSVNLMIIPLSAILVFIVLGLLYVSRWCMEDIREADGIHAKRYHTSGFISFSLPASSRQMQQAASSTTTQRAFHPEFSDGRLGPGHPSSTDLNRIHGRGGVRASRQTRILFPARSTRSLNGIRDRNCERANRKLAVGSDSSIQMTDMTSSASRYYRHGDRFRNTNMAVDGIVDSCRRAVGSFLQSHVIVVPIDRNITSTAASAGNAGPVGSRTRTRNHSSPASSTKTGSCCSENRPLLALGSTSSDGRMTSSDSNIDVMSPMSTQRHLPTETRNRAKPVCCVNSAGNLANRIIAFQHGRHIGRMIGGGYDRQSSAPVVSKLVHDSLNLSFRFFQVPLSSDPSSGKESLDSVFVCGIYADDSSSAATSAGNDVMLLKPEVDAYDGSELTMTLPSSRVGNFRQQPRPSKEMASTFCNSAFDRQSSADEQEVSSSQRFIEVPDVHRPTYEGVILAAKDGTNEQVDHGAILRRWKSANELQMRGEMSDRRSRKCKTT